MRIACRWLPHAICDMRFHTSERARVRNEQSGTASGHEHELVHACGCIMLNSPKRPVLSDQILCTQLQSHLISQVCKVERLPEGAEAQNPDI